MTDLYAEALSTFAELFEEAKASNEIEPSAMTVATAVVDGLNQHACALLAGGEPDPSGGRFADRPALLRVLEPYGIKELVQSGVVAVGRGGKSISDRSLRAVDRSA